MTYRMLSILLNTLSSFIYYIVIIVTNVHGRVVDRYWESGNNMNGHQQRVGDVVFSGLYMYV